MPIIIKTRGSQPIDDKDKQWAEAKFAKLARILPPEAVVEIVLEDLFGPKGGVDKKVHVLATLPHSKEPFHLEEVDKNFRLAITTARDRFERYLKKYRERMEMSGRFPRKYWLSDIFSKFRRNPSSDDK